MLRKDARNVNPYYCLSKMSGLETVTAKDTTIDVLTIGNQLALTPSANKKQMSMT